ncbi:hypothetical protein JZU68_00110, partial [bacterium]|nr:hypothetical protein [bacterium]
LLVLVLPVAPWHTPQWEKPIRAACIPEKTTLLFSYRTLHTSFGIISDDILKYDDTLSHIIIQGFDVIFW